MSIATLCSLDGLRRKQYSDSGSNVEPGSDSYHTGMFLKSLQSLNPLCFTLPYTLG